MKQQRYVKMAEIIPKFRQRRRPKMVSKINSNTFSFKHMSMDRSYLLQRTEAFEQECFTVFGSRKREKKVQDVVIATDTHPTNLLRDVQIWLQVFAST